MLAAPDTVGPLVIGLSGPLGSGISAVSRALEKNSFHRLSLSRPIKAELRKREGLPELEPLKAVGDWRKKLQDIGNEGRRESPSHWVDRILQGNPPDKDLVIDGIRNLGELQALRNRFPMFFLLALSASLDVRWSRLQDGYDKNFKTFERDDRRDSDEGVPEGQQVTKCVENADYILVNEHDGGSSAQQAVQFYERLEPAIDLMRDVNKRPRSYRRPPTNDEVHMATAYAQSHMSLCIKRHVGAIIVSDRNLPLALGYNENPVGMRPCVHEYKYCFKDDYVHKKLEKMCGVHCPSCGKKHAELKEPWKCAGCGDDFKALLFPSRNMERCTAIHAEERAIRSLQSRTVENTALYTTTFPCFQCARYIVDAGIKRVVYVEAYPIEESEGFMKSNGISVEPFEGFKARAFNLVFKQVD